MKKLMVVLFACVMMSACAPKVGSPEWCKKMDEKSKGDWSMNDAKDYAEHCLLK